MTHDGAVERVARQLARVNLDEKYSAMSWEDYIPDARAAMAEMLAILSEPTERMTINGYVYCYKPSSTWQAMLAASPLVAEKEGQG